MGYRSLVDGDVIQVGDQWFNGDWDGPLDWVSVKQGNENIGKTYNSEKMYPVRRPIEEE